MASTGNTFPGTGENNAGIGATAWTSPGNIVSDNTTDATCNAAASSQYLVARNFGFAIPSTATINGITVRVEASEHSAGTEALLAQLQNDSGTLFGSSKSAAAEGNISGTTKAVYTYGGTADVWGATLTPTICNDADFGVRLWFTTAHDVRIDYVTLAVEYTNATTHTKAGQGNAGFAVSGVRNTDHLRTGASAAGFTSSGADVVQSVEAGKADAGFTASGADVAEFSELGSGKVEFTASGAKAVEYIETGSAAMGLAALGADVAEYREAGTGSLGYSGRGPGSTGNIYQPSGTGTSELTAGGAKAIAWTEAGAGALGASASGTAIKGTQHSKSGTGAITMVASGPKSAVYGEAGSGFLGWKAEGFTSDRVISKTGGAAMECFGGGGFISGVAGAQASLLEAFSLRGGNVGIPLMPTSRR